MKHILTLALLVMQIAVCTAQPTTPLTNPTAESKVLYIVADSCDYLMSDAFFHTSKKIANAFFKTLNIHTKSGSFAIGCREEYIFLDNNEVHRPIERTFPKSDLDKTPTIRMKDFAKGKSAKQLQRAFNRWQEEYDYVFVTKCYNPDIDQQERLLAVDSYIYKPSKVRYPHYPIDSLTNAIERGVRIVVIDSDKPYAKRLVRDKTAVLYAHGIFALQFGYEVADRNGEKSKTQHIATQENLYAPNEINTYTVDRKSFRLEGEEVLDLSRLAEQNDIEEVWSQYLKFSKGHIIYLIDRADMTKNTMTVRTNNTYWVLIDSFGPSPKNRKGGGK